MPHYAIDGMDIDAVTSGITQAVERARSGGGPTFIEAKTYRFAGHSRADQALYRPEGELEKWKPRDPLLLMEQRLISKGLLDSDTAEKMKSSMKDVIENMVKVCQAAPEPTVDAMFKNIWTPKVRA
jgi:pyruvate dehydrogenase E1 component alpha subunit